MSVDAEIVKVREAIARVHATFADLTLGINNVTVGIDQHLDLFSQDVRDVEHEVAVVKNGVLHITEKFPSRISYLGVLLAVDVLIWLLAGFLLYKIIQSCRMGPENSLKYVNKYQQVVSPGSQPVQVFSGQKADWKLGRNSVFVPVEDLEAQNFRPQWSVVAPETVTGQKRKRNSWLSILQRRDNDAGEVQNV